MDPLSFTASLVGIATFAGSVFSTLSKYCKAVKDCEDCVQKLKAELNVLCAVLDRLANEVEEEDEEEEVVNEELLDIMEDVEEDHDGSLTDSVHNAGSVHSPRIPPYISACQMTLNEIYIVLKKFERGTSTKAHGKSKRQRVFGHLSGGQLKWPLSKEKTMDLVTRLGRYTQTCILALSATELSGIRKVLETTEFTKTELSEIKSTGKTILEFHLNEEENDILKWFAPVNSALKHREFRREYQEGTGLWIFETPEYLKWLEHKNSALWIHAIPGAGKTIIASLLIETLSTSTPRGFAYYYCRYDDAASQKPQSILGSLIAQLCLQDTGALSDAKAFYLAHNSSKKLPTVPTEKELGQLLKTVSRRFDDVNLVIDGLDEVGAALSVDRLSLIETLSCLHQEPSTISTIVLSRAETDIKTHLVNFEAISIAAVSADLKLYVAAKVPTLKIRDRNLQSEVIEALVDGAEGMFFWTVCQVMLLKGLPNAASIRKALKSLPPGMPGTFARIFEKIDRDYPLETQRLIKRALV